MMDELEVPFAHAGLQIDRHMRPHAGVAVLRPGIVLPGLVAELAGPRNRIPTPQLFAGANVPGTHDALGVVVSRYGRPFPHGGPYDHHVAGHSRSRMDADLATFEVDLLVIPLLDADLDVEDAVVAKGRDQGAGLGVELDQAIAGGHVDDALVAAAVGPVGDAASR